MSSIFGPGGSDRPPAIYGSANKSHFEQVMIPVVLAPTADPVWPEDEAREERADKKSGREIPQLAQPNIAREIAEKLRVALPDRLLGCLIAVTPQFNYYGFSVPTTIGAGDSITPRRLHLELTLEDARKSVPSRVPIACGLHPGTKVATEITHIGEFRIDLGKVTRVVWPGMSDIITFKAGGSLDWKRVRAKVLAEGRNRHECGWLISDTAIAYDFNPSCVIQVPKGAQLSIRACLSVEVRKRVAGVFYKTYANNKAAPVTYVLGQADYESFELNKMLTAARRPSPSSDKPAILASAGGSGGLIQDLLARWADWSGYDDTRAQELLKSLKELRIKLFKV